MANITGRASICPLSVSCVRIQPVSESMTLINKNKIKWYTRQDHQLTLPRLWHHFPSLYKYLPASNIQCYQNHIQHTSRIRILTRMIYKWMRGWSGAEVCGMLSVVSTQCPLTPRPLAVVVQAPPRPNPPRRPPDGWVPRSLLHLCLTVSLCENSRPPNAPIPDGGVSPSEPHHSSMSKALPLDRPLKGTIAFSYWHTVIW